MAYKVTYNDIMIGAWGQLLMSPHTPSLVTTYSDITILLEQSRKVANMK